MCTGPYINETLPGRVVETRELRCRCGGRESSLNEPRVVGGLDLTVTMYEDP